MRQVPQYLLIGNGRVASHFQYYFSLLQLPCEKWSRSESLEQFHLKLDKATHVLLLISDQAIEPFFIQHLKTTNKLCIHFSGSLVSDNIYGAHPLMSFNRGIYSLLQYQAIPFVLDHDAPAFDELLPGLMNPHVRLAKTLKEKYHALCVLSGNFSCLLWRKFFDSLENEFNLPKSISHPYLMQQMQNLMTDPDTALTGPLVRGDTLTIEKNLKALRSDPFQDLYQSFISCYQRIKEV